MSTHADTAKAIRKELKKIFPLTKFSVTSKNNSIDINWLDGPSTKQINGIVYKYQYGRFNLTEDMYDYTNVRDNIPQVKYLFLNREISEYIKQEMFEDLKKTHCGFESLSSIDENNEVLLKKWGCWNARQYITTNLCDKDFTNRKDQIIKEDI